jgi:hypothetical protein
LKKYLIVDDRFFQYRFVIPESEARQESRVVNEEQIPAYAGMTV